MWIIARLKIQVKQKKPNNKKKKHTDTLSINYLPMFLLKKKFYPKKKIPYVEITLSTQCKQKLLISWTSDKHKLFPVVFLKKTIPYIMFKNSSKTKKPNKKKAHALSIIYPHSYWKKKNSNNTLSTHCKQNLSVVEFLTNTNSS